jgi:serine/threonine protein kinase
MHSLETDDYLDLVPPENAEAPLERMLLPDGDFLELGNVIGRGGFGEVRIVRRAGDATACVGKFLHTQALTSSRMAGSVARMRTEISILKGLDISGVPALLDHGTREGVPYLLLRRIEGVSWRELPKVLGGAVPLPFILHSCAEQAGTIAEMHARGIVHSDLKPENMLFGRAERGGHWRSWIIDFGLSRNVASSGTRITAEGQTVGTHGYLDPRHIERALERDFSGDVYALGATWFEWYTGGPLFSSEQWQRILRLHQEGTVESCVRMFDEHVRTRLASCSRMDAAKRSKPFEAILRDMLLSESVSHHRPDTASLVRRLSPLLHRTPESLRCATVIIDTPREAVERIVKFATNRPLPLKRISAIAAVVTLSLAALLTSASPPLAPSAAPFAPETPPSKPPAATEAHDEPSVVIDAEILRVRQGMELLLQADLRKGEAWGSSQRPQHSIHGIPMEAKEMNALLECLRRGSSAGLPGRTYVCYCSRLTLPEGPDTLLVTPRGVIHATSGKAAFYDHDALQRLECPGPRKHVERWGTQGKILDKTLQDGLQEPETARKALVRANEYLRAFQQRVGIRAKGTR